MKLKAEVGGDDNLSEEHLSQLMFFEVELKAQHGYFWHANFEKMQA